ncbi:MAG TPA: HAD family phosphatase [Cyclobacteriaceae bacterium]|nr:HAD family phosphatase [Cyclobacteriaceae bacterium]
MDKKIDTVVFDLGGVLIDWNPRYLYRKIFKTEDEITWFMTNICTSEWNDLQDAGRSFADATEELVKKHPQHELPIRAWYGRFPETISGAIQPTVDVLTKIRDKKAHRLYALTNWSAESFPWAQQNFEFLSWFEGIVVSGVEKTRKPFPEIYELLLKRYSIDPARAVFIDDNIKNIKAANEAGLHTIHFTHAADLEEQLQRLNVL